MSTIRLIWSYNEGKRCNKAVNDEEKHGNWNCMFHKDGLNYSSYISK